MESGLINLPEEGRIFNSGSKLENRLATDSWNPLKTDSVQINVRVANVIPQIEIIDITLIALCFFLEKR